MGILRDPLHAKGAAPTQSAAPGPKATPKYNRRGTDTLGEDSYRYPAKEWPITTPAERDALLDQIGADLAEGKFGFVEAYHERLRWAFRCMKEGI